MASALEGESGDLGSNTALLLTCWVTWLDCSRYVLPACPKILDPVCGTDNFTYANECILCESVRCQFPFQAGACR
uniref:Kazal-like domain-containing protein n=1 Tax=Pelusios castaneus TaxID=367368 RepID=A0A8C8VJ53_9SAUR